MVLSGEDMVLELTCGGNKFNFLRGCTKLLPRQHLIGGTTARNTFERGITLTEDGYEELPQALWLSQPR